MRAKLTDIQAAVVDEISKANKKNAPWTQADVARAVSERLGRPVRQQTVHVTIGGLLRRGVLLFQKRTVEVDHVVVA